MIKLNILNMNDFLQTVNSCSGAVNILYPDRQKENINKQCEIQRKLWQQYKDNGKQLKLSLEIPKPGDYMKMVCYYAGDC